MYRKEKAHMINAIKKQITAVGEGLIGLVYPPLCPICGEKTRNGDALCQGCAAKVKKNLPPYCVKCGRSLRGLTENVENCWECSGKDFHYERSWSACLYEGAIKEALHLFKYSGKVSISRLFSGLLIDFLNENAAVLDGVETVAAVPLHPTKLREREFNQAHMLAAAVARQFGIKKDGSAYLRRIAYTKPQSELDKDQRRQNVTGAFRARAPGVWAQKNALLVDDLFTTGATLNECAKILKAAGARSVRCLTLAKGA